jgi:ABC-type nitrate/sulfonate/bicarbonate transport system substrate-binding protein
LVKEPKLSSPKGASPVMKRLWIASFLPLLIFCAPVFAPAQTLKVGYISKDVNHLPYFIAQKKGFLAKEGVQVDLVNIGRGDIQLEALVARELHISTVNADGIIIWNERSGDNLKVIAPKISSGSMISRGRNSALPA